jgi:probable phosphoglycerate mutase
VTVVVSGRTRGDRSQLGPGMLKLLFIRHGESVGNRDQRMAGRSDDALTPLGRHQCQQLGRWWLQHCWPPSHVYCSPQRRALESVCELIKPWRWELPTPVLPPVSGNYQRVALQSAEDDTTLTAALPEVTIARPLQEFDAGILTNLTWAEAQARYPALCQALETSPDWVPIPNAETPTAGRDRAAAFIHHLLERHTNQQAIWIMSHHWIMEHLIASLFGSDRTWKITILNTALFEFWLDRDRWSDGGVHRGISDLWQIKRFGDCHHLHSDELILGDE